ncbi:gamma-glutamyltranspeptidase-like protein [Clathrospora elynae]|uniref:Glutathione hydrolase n=1 Tax=Clathrospora elynae TaxID=706981 RepID=A0A6A5SWD1_9PLEO|nr:gamma-glutamyltranspeptidase-like protein [Clathrospora elynae]
MARASLAKCLTGLLTLQTAFGTPVKSNEPYPSSASSPPILKDGQLGAVASESDICSHIGIDLLKLGGNAADAMVGTVACIGVVGMYHSGIGGGGFMLVRAPNGTYEFIDFRETAPAAAFEDMYKNNVDASITGGLASGVPGELRGLQHLHEKYGVLPWTTVLTPAVSVARNGWTVNEDLVKYMASATATAVGNVTSNFLVEDLEFALDFAPQGRLLKLNETITRKRYADTLETIAQHGADAFYSGPIAEATIRALQARNGTMTLADLQNYTVAIRKPSTITYRDYKLTSCSAPSGGEVALATLKIMEGYSGVGDPENINLTTHRLDESMKFAYGMRANLGDPLFLKGIDKYQEEMLYEATAKEVRAKIVDNKTFGVAYYDPKGLESLETPGTSHIVTADHTGMAITLTTTVNLLFGSRIVVPETGVIMNNEMNDFSIPNTTNAFGYIPSPANFIRPGKRPLSSISPVIVEHLNSTLANAFYVAIGSAGGSRIITATIQNLIHILDGGLTTAEALAEPRLHDQLVPAQVTFEYGFDNSTTAFLQGLGANITWTAPGGSTAQGLRRLMNGTFEAAGEPRQTNSGGFVV